MDNSQACYCINLLALPIRVNIIACGPMKITHFCSLISVHHSIATICHGGLQNIDVAKIARDGRDVGKFRNAISDVVQCHDVVVSELLDEFSTDETAGTCHNDSHAVILTSVANACATICDEIVTRDKRARRRCQELGATGNF